MRDKQLVLDSIGRLPDGASLDAIAERTLGHATVMRQGEETPLEAAAKHA